MTKELGFKAGELLVFSEGIYSDYGYMGSFVALESVSQQQMLEIEQEVKVGLDTTYDGTQQFVAALIKRGWILSIPHREIHLGEYGLSLE